MAGGAADVAAAAADSAAAAAAPPEQAQQEKATCKCNGGRCHDCGGLCKRCQCTCLDKPKKRRARGRPPKSEASNNNTASLESARRSSSRSRNQTTSGGGDGAATSTPNRKRAALSRLNRNTTDSSPTTKGIRVGFGLAGSFFRRHQPPPDVDGEEECKECMRRNDPDQYLALYSEEEEEANKKYRGSDRGTTPGVKIESLGDATEAFGIADDEAKNLPSFADRFGQQSLTTKNPKGAERTTNVVVKACNKLVDAFVGAASRNDLIAAVGSKLLRQSMLSDELSVTGKSTEIVRENSAPK